MNKVVYVTKGGNTKKLAETMSKAIGVSAESITPGLTVSNVDVLLIGGSIYAGKIDGDLRGFLERVSPDQVKQAAVFSTSAGKKSALPEVKSILEARGVKVLTADFHCKGSFLLANKGRPNDEDLRNAAAFALKVCKGR